MAAPIPPDEEPRDVARCVRAVTLDAYGTLFDLDARAREALEEIVAGHGLGVAPLELGARWTEEFFGLLHSYGQSQPSPRFRTIRELTAESLRSVLGPSAPKESDVEAAVELWFGHVRRAELYAEARAAVGALAEAGMPLAIVSDADRDIIDPVLERSALPVDIVITSEDERSYKIDPRGTLFERAFEALGVRPGEVAHVGDSRSDVVGAARAGAWTVWVCRDGAEPFWAGRADIVARDLMEAARALGCG